MSTKNNLKVKEVMLSTGKFPILLSDAVLKDALDTMCKNKFGSVCIINNKKKLLGIITDGDIRRVLLRSQKPLSALMVEDLSNICTRKPKQISSSLSLKKAINLMQKNKIWDLPVTDKHNKLIGLLHLHNALNHLG